MPFGQSLSTPRPSLSQRKKMGFDRLGPCGVGAGRQGISPMLHGGGSEPLKPTGARPKSRPACSIGST